MKRSRIFLLITCTLALCLLGLLTTTDAYAAGSPNFYDKQISLPGDVSTEYYHYTYTAATPEVTSFMDGKGYYNVAYFSEGKLYIQRYDKSLSLHSTLTISPKFPYFGNVICDTAGNYYVCWGQADRQAEDVPVLSLSKYNYSGNLIGELVLTGFEATPYNPGDYWGTQIPFDAGTCAMAINGDILACNYARQMYSGHQSNYVVYVNCQTMEKVSLATPYCSHSFDQDCIATSDGGFLMANHGDAYPRSFEVEKVNLSSRYEYSCSTFHLREGTNRDHGYNETYAQLGGIAETDNAYILCASSERTLSLDVAPTKDYYCSYSEARDLFIQLLKKDFYNYTGANMYLVPGENRKAVGTRPQNAATDLFLPADAEDFGVIWLTDYDDQHFVANPKVLAIPENRILIMWEKRDYNYYELEASYFMILNEDGSFYQNATSIGKNPLPTNADVVYDNGFVYWTTANNGASYINVLETCVHTYTNDADTTCNNCGDFAYPGGNTIYYEGGKWYHVVDRKKVKDTTLVNYGGKWWYIKDGVNVSATTLVNYGGTWYYVQNGIVNFSANTLVKYGNSWYHVSGGKWVKDNALVGLGGTTYYVKNGTVDFSASGLTYCGGNWYNLSAGKLVKTTTLINYGGKWWYVQNGAWTKATTLVKYGTTWYYVKNGIVDFTANTLVKYGTTWYHVSGGKWVKDNAMVSYGGTLHYVKNGTVDFTVNGFTYCAGGWYNLSGGKAVKTTTLINYGGKWWYVKDGVWTKTTTLVKYGSVWYYVKDGIVDFAANTLVQYGTNWYHVKSGKWIKDTAMVSYGGTTYYVENGMVDFTASGLTYCSGNWYNLSNGKLVKTSTLVNYGGKWWYVKSGAWTKVTTLVKYNGTWYYVKNGIVDFTFSGSVPYGGKYYTVKNGKMVS